MTMSLCTNCGNFKVGAWCECPVCHAQRLGSDLDLLLTDHYLTEDELKRIAQAISLIWESGLDEDTRFALLAYFLSRKFPKLLTFDFDALDDSMQDMFDKFYAQHLAHLPGQKTTSVQESRGLTQAWQIASSNKYQAEDSQWQVDAIHMVMHGLGIAKRTCKLYESAGEFAALPKFLHAIRSLTGGVNYDAMLAEVPQLVEDGSAYQREVNRFCGTIKNGWSDRTKQMATYFLWLCQHLLGMTQECKRVLDHKAGVRPLIGLDLERARQEYKGHFKSFSDFAQLIIDPSRIQPHRCDASREQDE